MFDMKLLGVSNNEKGDAQVKISWNQARETHNLITATDNDVL